MAFADTAKLVASLELQDKFSRGIGSAERSLGGFERRLGPAQRATRGLGVAGTAAGVALGSLATIGISAGIRGLTNAFTGGINSLQELEVQTTATNTVLKSTKGIAGVTADQVRALAEEYEGLNATIDDKVIQGGENLLLTFTNIRKKAFQPALEAALNMNEAMGGGPEGLQSTIIQVGKALQDPIRGATALRRVGVNLSEEQQAQIAKLVKQNDLYGAQKIVLDELSTEFGGRFAAAGKTAAGQAAKLSDAMEDLEKKFAGPLEPAIRRIRTHLIDLLGSDSLQKGAERLGDAIAGIFTNKNLDKGVDLIEGALDMLTGADFSGVSGNLSGIVTSVAGLPWEAIGSAAKLLGTGSKALLTAFTSLPGWVQTAVLTGWGLNKLTGGALTGIIGELGKGLVKGVLGMNAGVVNVNAATVNTPGGGIPGVGGAAGGGSTVGKLATGVAKFVLGPAAAVIIGSEIAAAINEKTIRPAIDFETDKFKATLDHADAEQLRSGIAAINNTLDTSKTLGDPGYDALHNAAVNLSHVPFIGDALGNLGPELEKQRDELQKKLDQVTAEEAKTGQIYAHGASEHNKVIRQEWRAAAQKIDGGILNLSRSERADAQKLFGETRRITPGLSRIESIERGVSDHTRSTADRTAQAIERIRAVESAGRATAANTAAVARKNFSPNVDLTVGVTNTISVSTISGAIQRETYSTATGRVGGKIIG